MLSKRITTGALRNVCWAIAILNASSFALGLALLAVTGSHQPADLARPAALQSLSNHLPLLAAAELLKMAQAAFMIFLIPAAATHLQRVARAATVSLGWGAAALLAFSAISGLIAMCAPQHAQTAAAFAAAFGVASLGVIAGWHVVFGAKLVICQVLVFGTLTFGLGILAATALVEPELISVVAVCSVLWWGGLGWAIERDVEGVRSAI